MFGKGHDTDETDGPEMSGVPDLSTFPLCSQISMASSKNAVLDEIDGPHTAVTTTSNDELDKHFLMHTFLETNQTNVSCLPLLTTINAVLFATSI